MSVKPGRYASLHAASRLIVGIVAAALACLPLRAKAQLPETVSADTEVSLLTLLPGEPIYSAFAHSAFRILDRRAGIDAVFNYGTFDSSDPFFLARFTYGKMDYYLSVYGMQAFMQAAVAENRSVIEQKLRLSEAEVAALYRTLRVNARPENRVYRYDFLAENCSTILLDLLHETLGEHVQFDSSGTAPVSYRELLQPYVEERPFWDVGIHLALGAPVDQPVDYFESSFLPVELLHIVDDAVVDTTAGARAGSAPLVATKDTLLWVGQGYTNEDRFPWLAVAAWGIVIGLIAYGNVVGKGRERNAHRVDRWFFGVLGALGLFLTYMWFGTLHYVTDYNWNILWALPAHLLVAISWNRLGARFLRVYFFANAALLAAFLIAQPLVPQKLHVVYFPLVVLILWRSWRIGRRLAE